MKREQRVENKISELKNTISAYVSEVEILRKDVEFYKELLDLLQRKSEELDPCEFKQFFDEEIIIEKGL